MSDVLPEWAVRLCAAARKNKLTGFIVLNLRAGEVRHVKIEETHFPPQERGAPLCPRGCGEMQSRDRGTMYVCPDCGAKQTLNQVTKSV